MGIFGYCLAIRHPEIQINAFKTFFAGINLFRLGSGLYGLLIWLQRTD